jgi:hypothetical protein
MGLKTTARHLFMVRAEAPVALRAPTCRESAVQGRHCVATQLELYTHQLLTSTPPKLPATPLEQPLAAKAVSPDAERLPQATRANVPR